MLLASLSEGASKSGAVINDRAPVEELMVNRAASVPEIDQLRVDPASTSLPVKVVTLVIFSAWEIA
jgi:hypothetical protein